MREELRRGGCGSFGNTMATRRRITIGWLGEPTRLLVERYRSGEFLPDPDLAQASLAELFALVHRSPRQLSTGARPQGPQPWECEFCC